MGNITGRFDFDGPPGGEYLRLQASKAPVSWEIHTLEMAAGIKHAGIKLTEPYVVVDVDDAKQAEKLTNLVQSENIKCRIMQTTKGRHFWFRTAEPVKNTVRTSTGIGLMVDYRSWGKKSQVCVKLDGQWREWLNYTPWDSLDELPKWLRPLRQDRWRFYEMGEGDGRNTALYEYQIMLASRAYSQPEASEVIRLINNYVLEKPLPKQELAVICREEAYPEPAVETSSGDLADPSAPWFIEGKNGLKTFLHHVMGERIIGDLRPITCRGSIYVYRDGYYQPGENVIQKEIVRLWPGSKKSNQNEVLNYITIQTHTDRGDTDEHAVNLINGRLDLKSWQLKEHSPDHIDFQRINAAFNPRARCIALDDMLMRVFCDDLELYALFEEIMGYCLIRNSKYHKLFVFSGDGSNGKSTVLKVIRHFLGEGNVSTVSLQGLEDKFKTAELENKLANLGDDIPAFRVKDSSQLKTLSSGDSITVERKNKDPFILKNYAKLIFSTNKMPNIDDQSHGLGRRLCIIPFDAKFSSKDKDFDPDIENKVMTDEAMSAMLNLAIRGLKRLTRRGKFTESSKVAKATEAFRIDNSNVLSWLDDEGKEVDDFIGKGTIAIYQEYRLYCEQNGMIPKKKTGLTQEINKTFGLAQSKLRRIGGGRDRVYLQEADNG